jgi:hypothetical protein
MKTPSRNIFELGRAKKAGRAIKMSQTTPFFAPKTAFLRFFAFWLLTSHIGLVGFPSL